MGLEWSPAGRTLFTDFYLFTSGTVSGNHVGGSIVARFITTKGPQDRKQSNGARL